MKKKNIIFVLIIITLLVIGGVFWWINRPKEIKGSPDDYVIKDTQEGSVVENSKAGLRFKVPDGWRAKKVEVEEGSVVLYSPDAESVYPTGSLRPPLKKGCMIEIAVGYRKMDFEKLKKEIQRIHEGLAVKLDEVKETKIHNVPTLENRFECVELGFSINLYPVLEDKFYSISLSLAPQEREKCSKAFDKFLATLSFE